MRERIIQSAIKLVEKDGVKFTLSEVAASIKISKKTIYKFFKGKDELISAVIVYIFSDIHRQIDDICALPMSTLNKLKEVVGIYPTVINFDTFKLNKLVELYPDIHKSITAQFDINWEKTLALYDQCVIEGSVREIPREYFMTVLLGIYDRALHYDNHREVTRACIDAVFSGFAKEA